MSLHDPVTAAFHVRPGDLDSQGHVNNARVLEFLEHGRWLWLRQQDLELGIQVAAVVMRAEVDYRREIGWGEVIVSTRLRAYEESAYRVVFEQQLSAPGPTGVLLASALMQVAFVDVASRSLVSVEDALAASGDARRACSPGVSSLNPQGTS